MLASERRPDGLGRRQVRGHRRHFRQERSRPPRYSVVSTNTGRDQLSPRTRDKDPNTIKTDVTILEGGQIQIVQSQPGRMPKKMVLETNAQDAVMMAIQHQRQKERDALNCICGHYRGAHVGGKDACLGGGCMCKSYRLPEV